VLSAKLREPDARSGWLEIAEQYDLLAEMAERLEDR
jgi:hypothetical protein